MSAVEISELEEQWFGFSMSPGSVAWSLDNRITIITDEGIHIMDIFALASSTEPGLEIRNRLLPAHSPWTLDTGLNSKIQESIDRESFSESDQLALLRDCGPNPNSLLTYFKTAAWSPLGCDADGRCLLACLTMDHHLLVYSTAGNKLKLMSDLSADFSDFMKARLYKVPWSSDLAPPNPPIENKLLATHLERTKHMSFTAMCWSEAQQDSDSLNDSMDGAEPFRFCYLVAATRGGTLAIYQCTMPCTESCLISILSLSGLPYPDPVSIACSHWISREDQTEKVYLLATGYSNGKLSVGIVQRKDIKLQYVHLHDLWEEADLSPPTDLTFTTVNNEIILLAVKGSLLLTVSISLENLDDETPKLVRRIDHTLACGGLPINSLCCRGNRAMLSSDGEVISSLTISHVSDGATQILVEPVLIKRRPGKQITGLWRGLGIAMSPYSSALVAYFLAPDAKLDKSKQVLRMVLCSRKTFDESLTFCLSDEALLPHQKQDYLQIIHLGCSTQGDKALSRTSQAAVECKKFGNTRMLTLRNILQLLACREKLLVRKGKDGKMYKRIMITVEIVDVTLVDQHLLSNFKALKLEDIEQLSEEELESLRICISWFEVKPLLLQQHTLESKVTEVKKLMGTSPSQAQPCSLCNADVPLESLSWGRCTNGHNLPRCRHTFLQGGTSKHCNACKTPYRQLDEMSSVWLHRRRPSNCVICGSFIC